MTREIARASWWADTRWWAPLSWIVAPEPAPGSAFEHEPTLLAHARRLDAALENARNTLAAPGLAHSVYRPLLQGRGDVADCRYSVDGAIARVGAPEQDTLERVLAEALRRLDNVRAGAALPFAPPPLDGPRQVTLRNACQTASGGSYFAWVALRMDPAPEDPGGVRLLDAWAHPYYGVTHQRLLRDAIMDEARDLMLRGVTLTIEEVRVHMVDDKPRAWQMAGRAAVRRAMLGAPPGR